MLGTTRLAGGFVFPRVECIDGAVGNEYRVELVVGEKCSTEDCDETDKMDWRGCGWA